MPIEVIINGASDSVADYDEDEFLRLESLAQAAIANFYNTGARVENIASAVQTALEDVGAAE
jgi:hypothetical protein